MWKTEHLENIDKDVVECACVEVVVVDGRVARLTFMQETSVLSQTCNSCINHNYNQECFSQLTLLYLL